ncbi:Xanthine/uracil/vitamin C permease [Thermoanaerobacter mathranii subsp. mathranii str. A3]|jgi:AGZA family xanthine/uracil permease-like MFS transporter|uniref:AGZA family xanthine/uracil permease-like MFS transporter n=2 Tax=Thermoanaerobacter TaxID=1754 RepID=A0ABT9M4M7_9THEO|nr:MULTISPECIES: NCS2 family permease [Thermoanaerobacter]ADH60381.1 Xanthine/uracil/vitamin C permease [Thermoanaerobacter mathranii subsp. mathranii str. A3]MBT1279030.1 NCS2 family permease [Thermoanaerobacter sp. CM-CNRG TB177]MDK2814803.1 adenine/guanine/hypoxanthine permease [Thermoanaerobacter sp.]MDP9751084.1 AGZA family xanthine/uracil permease-like MFS transporter [Thermoanaerobacter pentosaceus]
MEKVSKMRNKNSLENLANRIWRLENYSTNVKTEILAGITTFITMAYIMFVNPIILKEAGMDAGAVFVATCLSAAIGTFMMALYANYPFAQAPGMGLNAFFTYTVVLTMGYTWQEALAAVFFSGIIFILITLTGIREMIVDAIPLSLKYAVSAGIGLFIAFIGLKNSGIIVPNQATYIGFGDLTNPGTLLAIAGLFITGILMSRNVKGSILLGILITTVLGLFTGIVKLPSDFSIIKMPPSLAPTFFKLDIKGLLGIGENIGFISLVTSVLYVVLSFAFVDLFDTIGTFIGTGSKAGMLDENGKMPNMKKGLMADAIATTIGSLLGTSTVTTYVESAAGIAEGGRTGLTAFVTGILFLVALFFSPIALLVPTEATAPALIIVGVLMMGSIKKISFEDFTEAMPAFLTIIAMPFTFSIANGIAAGLVAYPIVKIASGKAKEIHPIVYVLAILFILRFITLSE